MKNNVIKQKYITNTFHQPLYLISFVKLPNKKYEIAIFPCDTSGEVYWNEVYTHQFRWKIVARLNFRSLVRKYEEQGFQFYERDYIEMKNFI